MRDPDDTEGRQPLAPGRIIFALSLAMAAEGVFIGGILPIIPAIGRFYALRPGEAFWVSAIYLLSVGVTCPALCRLGDIHGHKRLIVIALIVSACGIALDIVAPTYMLFLAGRFLLGFCPAITPLAVGVFRNVLAEDKALSGIGAITAAMTAGIAVGPLISGYIFAATAGFGWVFGTWILLLVASMIAVIAWVPAAAATAAAGRRMDWPGALTLSIGVGGVLFALAYGGKFGWASGLAPGAAGLGIAALVVWIVVERRARFPLVNLAMLNRPDARPYYIASFLWGAAYFGSQTTVVLFLAAPREVLGFGFSASPVMLGWLLLPQNLAKVAGALSMAGIVRNRGGYRIAGLVGGVALSLGFLGIMLMRASLWPFILFFMMTGFGSGLLQATLSGSVSAVCTPDERGISTGMYQTLKNIGGSVASAFSSVAFAALAIGQTEKVSEGAYLLVFGACLVMSVGIVAAILAQAQNRPTATL